MAMVNLHIIGDLIAVTLLPGLNVGLSNLGLKGPFGWSYLVSEGARGGGLQDFFELCAYIKYLRGLPHQLISSFGS